MTDPVPTHDVLLIDRPRAGLAVMTLNRPQAMNALSLDLRRRIAAAFRALESEGVDVVVLTGAGRAFCAGLDLGELAEDRTALLSIANEDPAAALRGFSGVVIGAINGAAVTGGFELALGCDILIAGEAARFADSHAQVGVLPGWQLSQRLPRLIGPYRAKHVSLAGRKIDAQTALAWGLVSEVVPGDALLSRALAIADDMLSAPASMLRAYKRVLDEGYAGTLAEGIALEARTAAEHNATVTPDTIAGRRSAIQQRGRI